MPTDEELMCAVARGSTEAFEQIVQRFQPVVWRIAARFVGSTSEAQDIAQNAFMKLYQSAPRYRPSALLRTYLFRIVNTICIDHIRKKHPVPMEDLPEDHGSSSPAPDSAVIKERGRILRQAVACLPVRQRSAVVLRYDAELSVRDIAEILKTTEKSVEHLLAHARSSLLIRLRESGIAAGDF
jgi:RNA polymerase sigma-70 factor (ECF subfamily)